MKILIIEPHGDDALISCSKILRSGADIDLFTFASRDSHKMADHFDSIDKVTYLNSEEYHWKNRPVDHYQVKKWYKEGLNAFDEYMKALNGYPEFNQLVESVRGVLRYEIKDYDLVLVPLGVVHPFHCVVRQAIDDLLDLAYISPDNIIYYSEGPYNCKKYGEMLEEGALLQLGVEGLQSRHTYDEDWFKTKEEIYRKVYPTEVNLFRFSYDEVIKNTERYIGNMGSLRKLNSVLEEVKV